LRRSARRALAAIGVLLLAAILLQPFWLAPLVGRQLSHSAGRSVHFERMWLGLTPSLEPVVQWRGVRIDNAPWADSHRPFAALESAAMVFSWRSIEQHRPVISLMVLRDGEVDLERRADGLRNWRLANPEYRGPGRYKVLALQGERVTVRFLHGGIDLDLRATASSNAGTGADAGAEPLLPTRLDLEGEWRDLRFKASAATGIALTFLETGRTFPLRGFLEAGGARLDVDGRAGDIVREPLIDAHVALTAPSIAPFAAFIESRHREAKAVRLEGALKTDDGRYALSAAKGHVGATDLAGEIGWTRGEPRNVMHAKLTSDSADLADLRWLAGLRPRAAPAPAPAASSAGRADHSRARTVDAELSLVARRLHAAEVPWLQSAQLEASLLDGQLTVPRFDVGIAQGHASGHASVDIRDRPLHADVDLTLRGARLEQLLHDPAGKNHLTGALHGRAQLKASGDSAEALLAGVDGSVSVSLAGGTISSLLDAEIGLQGGKILRSLVAGAEPIAIRCGAATLDLGHGAGHIRSLALDTERTRTTGTGVIDLGHGTIDVVLTPEAKQPGLFVLERSIRLHGPLRQPARELVARAAGPAGSARACPSERP
jgi:uncharacterized protein involved in outer membrane biogenesis